MVRGSHKVSDAMHIESLRPLGVDAVWLGDDGSDYARRVPLDAMDDEVLFEPLASLGPGQFAPCRVEDAPKNSASSESRVENNDRREVLPVLVGCKHREGTTK